MATQTDVQQLIQGLTPGGVNNGNPNTAYNNAAIPMQNAAGQWMNPATSPAASIAALNLAPISTQLPVWQAPAASTANLLGMLPQLNGQLPISPVPGGAVTTPPVSGSPSVNLPEPPVQIGGGSPSTSPLPGAPGDRPPAGTMAGDLYDRLFGPNSPSYMGPSPGGSYNLGGGLGNLDWRQLLDATLIPGDAWLSGSNKWDLSNFLEGVLGQTTNLPISSTLNLLTNLYGNNLENAPQFLQDRYLDNLNNMLANTLNNSIGSTTAQLNQSIDQKLSEKLAQDLGKRGIDTRVDTEAARKAAETKAAQDYVASIQLNNMLQGTATAARNAMNRMFGGKER